MARQQPGKQGQATRRRSNRRQALILGTVVLVAAALLATALLQRPATATAQACPPNSPNSGTNVGQCAPNFTLDTPFGKPISLRAYQGHPVLIHFWAVACTTCAAEYPDFSRIVDMYTRKGLTVLAVDAWGEPAPMVQGWQDKHHLPATILVDPPTLVATLYKGTGTPTSYFVDRLGRVQASFAGPLSYAAYQQDLRKIM